MRLQAKQEELFDLQLEALRKQTQPSNGEKADIRVDLQPSGSSHKFVITNLGRVPARNVTFNLNLKEGRTTPLVDGDYDEEIPIPELVPGSRCGLFAALTLVWGPLFTRRGVGKIQMVRAKLGRPARRLIYNARDAADSPHSVAFFDYAGITCWKKLRIPVRSVNNQVDSR